MRELLPYQRSHLLEVVGTKSLRKTVVCQLTRMGLEDGALAFHRFKDLYARCGWKNVCKKNESKKSRGRLCSTAKGHAAGQWRNQIEFHQIQSRWPATNQRVMPSAKSYFALGSQARLFSFCKWAKASLKHILGLLSWARGLAEAPWVKLVEFHHIQSRGLRPINVPSKTQLNRTSSNQKHASQRI